MTRHNTGGLSAGAAEIRLLLRLVDEAFEKQSWHGPNLRGALRGVDAEEAAWRPRAGRHNIWEIAVHAAYWKYVVRRRLLGEKRGSFGLPGSNWFARPSEAGFARWDEDLRLLVQTHQSLRQAIAATPPTELDAPATGGKLTKAFLIRGIAFHDIYHAGQIQFLKRLYRQAEGNE